MWINRQKYERLVDENIELSTFSREKGRTIIQLRNEIEELKDDSGQAVVERLTKLAKDCKIDVHSETFQAIMTRLFLDIGGRESPMLKGYSATTFLKDNDEALLERLTTHIKEKNLLTKSGEKSKK